MTRLEDTEKWLRGLQSEPKLLSEEYALTIYGLKEILFALDCYKARVAVLEEALDDAVEFIYNSRAITNATELRDLTPEQCLARYGQKGAEDGGPNQ